MKVSLYSGAAVYPSASGSVSLSERKRDTGLVDGALLLDGAGQAVTGLVLPSRSIYNTNIIQLHTWLISMDWHQRVSNSINIKSIQFKNIYTWANEGPGSWALCSVWIEVCSKGSSSAWDETREFSHSAVGLNAGKWDGESRLTIAPFLLRPHFASSARWISRSRRCSYRCFRCRRRSLSLIRSK